MLPQIFSLPHSNNIYYRKDVFFRRKPIKHPHQVKPSFLGSIDVLSYFLMRTSSQRKSANPSLMPSAILLVSGDKHKKQRKQSTILKVQHIKIYDFYCCPLSVSYIVFYVYRPMSVCKRSEVTLCIMQDVDGRELAL